MECGYLWTPVRVKCSAWGLLAFAEDDPYLHAATSLVKSSVTPKPDQAHCQALAMPGPTSTIGSLLNGERV